MKASLWRSMKWSVVNKEAGWVLFHFEAQRGRWRLVRADLYTKERKYVGEWFKTSMPRNLITEAEKRCTKAFGKAPTHEDQVAMALYAEEDKRFE